MVNINGMLAEQNNHAGEISLLLKMCEKKISINIIKWSNCCCILMIPGKRDKNRFRGSSHQFKENCENRTSLKLLKETNLLQPKNRQNRLVSGLIL